LYTLSTNEWTIFAPIGLIQSASLPGRDCTGISLVELICLPALAHLVSSLLPIIFVCCLPQPNPLPIYRSVLLRSRAILPYRASRSHHVSGQSPRFLQHFVAAEELTVIEDSRFLATTADPSQRPP